MRSQPPSRENLRRTVLLLVPLAPLFLAVSWAASDETKPRAVSFVLVRLVDEDGSLRTVEADGEAWLQRTWERRLVRTLTSAERRELGEALADAGAERWAVGDATFARGRARLAVILTDGSTRSVGLPGDGAVQAIIELLRAATSDDAPALSGPGRR